MAPAGSDRDRDDDRDDDREVTGPDGRTYRVCRRRRGESLRRWDGADTGLGPLDLVVFVGSLGHRVVSSVRSRVRHGWTVGVLRDGDLRWEVVHREHHDDRAAADLRVDQLVQAVESGQLGR